MLTYTHVTAGTLPEDWSALSLEVIRVDQNMLEGPLPAAWFSGGALSSSLQVLTAWSNKLSGPLPASDGGMQVGAFCGYMFGGLGAVIGVLAHPGLHESC